MMNKSFLFLTIVGVLGLPNTSMAENHDWPAYGKGPGGGIFHWLQRLRLKM